MAGPFSVDHAAEIHAAQIDVSHHDGFRQLLRSLAHGPTFQFYLAEFGDTAYRDRVIAQIDAALGDLDIRAARVDLAPVEDVPALKQALVEAARGAQVVNVVGGEGWFDDSRWQAFNVRRETVARDARARLVFWLHGAQIDRLVDLAPDWWAWRAGLGVFVRSTGRTSIEPRTAEFRPFDPRPLPQRIRRMAVLRGWLADQPPPAEEERARLLEELAGLLYRTGRLDEALRILRTEALPVCERLGDARSRAVILGRIADILQAHGDLDEALRIFRTEALPAFKGLGDARERAVTVGKIADILRARGEVDEALRILRTEALPVFERLGDARERAATLVRIAKILQSRGEVDEALRILRTEALPVFERLGDARERAVTLGGIADILRARGEIDEALRILRTEALPAFERLGDIEARAATLGKIADILGAREEGDEALRIFRTEVLPAYEQLGEARGRALTKAKMGEILLQRDRGEALRLLREARHEFDGKWPREASWVAGLLAAAGAESAEEDRSPPVPAK